jgi:ubiquinone/menaquinone biosynthesis C-methylase UbiE
MEREGRFSQLKTEMVFDHTWLITVKAFIDEGRINDGDTILDAGCGWGRVISGLKFFLPSSTIVGIDANKIRLDAARQILAGLSLDGNVILECGDVDQLGLEDNTFDTVVSSRLLQYVPNPTATIKELCRVLKPGGRVVITVPNKLNPIRFFFYTRILYSPSSVKRWFIDNKLSDISCKTIGFIPPFKRLSWQSKLLVIEEIKKIPIINYMGGLVLCSGMKKPSRG